MTRATAVAAVATRKPARLGQDLDVVGEQPLDLAR